MRRVVEKVASPTCAHANTPTAPGHMQPRPPPRQSVTTSGGGVGRQLDTQQRAWLAAALECALMVVAQSRCLACCARRLHTPCAPACAVPPSSCEACPPPSTRPIPLIAWPFLSSPLLSSLTPGLACITFDSLGSVILIIPHSTHWPSERMNNSWSQRRLSKNK